jgi:hypothetical protein
MVVGVMVVAADMAAVVSAAAMLVLAVATVADSAVAAGFLVACVRLRVSRAASHAVRHFLHAVLVFVPSAGL